MFLIWVMINCWMKGKRNDWRIVALDTILGDAVMIRRQFWICLGLRQLDFEI